MTYTCPIGHMQPKMLVNSPIGLKRSEFSVNSQLEGAGKKESIMEGLTEVVQNPILSVNKSFEVNEVSILL